MPDMLHDPARHEPLHPLAWDAGQVRAAIEYIVRDTESRFTEGGYWPVHPLDREGEDAAAQFLTPLYHGACGVFWALHYLQDVGATTLQRSHAGELERLLARNRTWLGNEAHKEQASFMMGDTPIRMMAFGMAPSEATEAALDALIAGNTDHPARELMWGAPGTLLAAWFLHQRTGKPRWAELFRLTAARLWSQLQWSPQHLCAYWTQDLYGRQYTFLDAVHGFVATAAPLIHGRHLLDAEAWGLWEPCIVNTVQRTADRLGAQANWRPQLDHAGDAQKKLVQFCHGAPGFVICLAGLPGTALDELLLAAGETIWAAGPLAKGSNLCHGTGGNGYAFLKLFQRTQDVRWLERARAFAVHGIAQTQAHAAQHGQLRYSLWTGDLGFAIYLWDCLRAEAQFPTLDVFYAPGGRGVAHEPVQDHFPNDPAMQSPPLPDLHPSWLRAWRGIGARDDGEAIYQALMARYAEPHRKYHTLQHLHECLGWFEPAQGLASRGAEVETALWFHDAIYDLARSDNEAQSAAWARSAALQAGVAAEVAARVHALVMATRHTALPVGGDEQLLVDIDLAILGATPARFAEYEQQIREEYCHVPDGLFRPKRRAILRSFLERPRLYSTPQFHAALEDPARANLQRAIDGCTD